MRCIAAPTEFWYFRRSSFGNYRIVSSWFYATYYSQNKRMFFTRLVYLLVRLSTTLRKLRSISSSDFLNCTPKNYNSLCSYDLFSCLCTCVSRMLSGEEGVLTEKVADSVFSLRVESILGVLSASLGEERRDLGKEVSAPHEHLIVLTPCSDVLTSPHKHSAQTTWSQLRMVNSLVIPRQLWQLKPSIRIITILLPTFNTKISNTSVCHHWP